MFAGVDVTKPETLAQVPFLMLFIPCLPFFLRLSPLTVCISYLTFAPSFVSCSRRLQAIDGAGAVIFASSASGKGGNALQVHSRSPHTTGAPTISLYPPTCSVCVVVLLCGC